MEKFVFELDIVQPRREVHRCKFELDMEQVEKLLNPGMAAAFGFSGTVEELKDLMSKTGAVSTAVALAGAQHSVNQYVRHVAAQAWLNDLPWQVTKEHEEGVYVASVGDLIEAYVKAADDNTISMGAGDA